MPVARAEDVSGFRGRPVSVRARSVECVRAQSEFSKNEILAKAYAASRLAWLDGEILLISRHHPTLDFAERQMIDHLAKRIGVKS